MEDKHVDKVTRKELKILAVKTRDAILDEVYNAKSGHLGGSLSIVEMLVYLYFSHMRIRPFEPLWADRDRLVLSKGHVTRGRGC